jgi:RpiB/LacA/LacB family sugar-phosphate isomerase
MEIIIGCDHAGVQLKEEITAALKDEGYDVINCGTDTDESVDYPDFAEKVAAEVLQRKTLGVLICGTGIGISIAANKIPGIRAAVCYDIYTAGLAREHNNANILALGSRITGSGLAIEIVKTFIKTGFLAGRHERRVGKITGLENKYKERS